MPDRERAETYLRLQAEVQLQRALAMPEYKPREHQTSGFLYLSAQARHMRRRRAVVARLVQQQARAQGQPAHQDRGEPANQLERLARSLLAALAGWRNQIRHSAWHLRRRLRRQLPRPLRRRGGEPPPAEACVERVTELATVLAAVGAITAQTEADVVADFAFALAARGRIEPELLLADHGFPGHRMHRHASTPPPPSGLLRAHPVGVFASGEIEGVPIRFYFGVLVFDQSSVTVTIQVKFPPESFEHDHRHTDPMFDALSDIRAVDDRGGRYHADFSGGGGDGNWDGRLGLRPVPPAGLHWLDVTLPGGSVVRIPMDMPAADLRITIEAVKATAADRFIDALTPHLMLASPADAAAILGDDATPNGFSLAADLLAAGLVTTTSGSLRRLVAAAAYLGARPPRALAAIEPAELPADWLSLRRRAEGKDGPSGIIAVAAVLPEVDGVQCVIAELSSDADSATMQVHARGWPESRYHGGLSVDSFEWTARDNLGGWYLLGYHGGSSSGDEADLDFEFSPALDSRAGSLDITLTGPTAQVTVTVPLGWQEVA